MPYTYTYREDNMKNFTNIDIWDTLNMSTSSFLALRHDEQIHILLTAVLTLNKKIENLKQKSGKRKSDGKSKRKK